MSTAILIIAHAPLASALRACALHVFPDASDNVRALDIPADEAVEDSLGRAQRSAREMASDQLLVMTDVLGATPCNVASRLLVGTSGRLIAGVNLPMLLRSVNYLSEDIDALVQRALAGGTQCITSVEIPRAIHSNSYPP